MPMSLKKMKATHWFLGATFNGTSREGTVLLDGQVYKFKEDAHPTEGTFLRSVDSSVMPPAAELGTGLVRLAMPVRVVFKFHETRDQNILEVVNPEIDLPIVTVGTRLVPVNVGESSIAQARMQKLFVFEYDPSCLPDSVRVAPGSVPQPSGASPVPAAADAADEDDGVPLGEDQG